MTANNCITLIGRIAKEPKHGTTSTDKEWVYLRLAVKRRSKDADALFVGVKIYGHSAKYILDYGAVGRMLAVTGYLDSYEHKETKGEVFVVMADDVTLLDSKPQSEETPTAARPNLRDDEIPF